MYIHQQEFIRLKQEHTREIQDMKNAYSEWVLICLLSISGIWSQYSQTSLLNSTKNLLSRKQQKSLFDAELERVRNSKLTPKLPFQLHLDKVHTSPVDLLWLIYRLTRKSISQFQIYGKWALLRSRRRSIHSPFWPLWIILKSTERQIGRMWWGMLVTRITVQDQELTPDTGLTAP